MTGQPIRLRLSRRAGFDLQNLSRSTNALPAVNVARPTRWGNPYRVSEFGREQAVALFKARLTSEGTSLLDLTFLRGKNLACWCPLDQLCHADVLLKIANGAKRQVLASPCARGKINASDQT